MDVQLGVPVSRDEEKTKEQLIAELKDLRLQVDRLKISANNFKKAEEEILHAQELLIKEHKELHNAFKLVENAKREWERTMDCVGDMIILTDKDGIIRRCNSSFARFTGMPYHMIIQKDWEEFLHENNMEVRTRYGKSTELFQSSTGKWFELNTYPYNDSDLNSPGTVITIHDNTDLKVITEELMNSNRVINENREKLQSGLKEITALIQNVTKQIDYGVRFFNPNLSKCYEVRNCRRTKCVCFGRGAVRCWQTEGTLCEGGRQESFADKYEVCSACIVFKKATSDPVYQIGEQFNNMMHVLEMKNKELESAYAELKSTQTRILQQEKMASIGQLAAGVAHEINNPMGFISSNLGTLGKYAAKLAGFIRELTEITGQLEGQEQLAAVKEHRRQLKIDYILEDIEPLINESLEGADRVKTIVQNLKTFSRIDEADCKPADINDCIESTLSIVWNELKYNAVVRKDYGELPLTMCHPQQLNQVFMNLLVNAGQAIENHGEIVIKTWSSEGSIYVSISDTGNGIPQDRLTKIFEPFYTTKEVGKGTGLGLSITYEIVKKHNGDITVESQVGKGTTFTIKIPVVEEEKPWRNR